MVLFPLKYVAILLFAVVAIHAQPPEPQAPPTSELPRETYLASAERGKSIYNTGSKISRVGLYIVAAGSSLALVSVANPDLIDLWFASFFGTLTGGGGALVFIGIPIMGHGADKTMEAAIGLNSGFQSSTPDAWPLYRQSWKWIGAGAGLLPFAVGFSVIGALNWEDPSNNATMIGAVLFSTSLGMGAVGLIEQGYCWYRFSRRHKHANAVLHETATISLLPVIRIAEQGFEGAGMRLVAEF